MHRAEDARIVASLASLIAAALLIVAAAVYLGSVRQDTLQHDNEERVVTQSVEPCDAPSRPPFVTMLGGTRPCAISSSISTRTGRTSISVPTSTRALGYEVALVVRQGPIGRSLAGCGRPARLRPRRRPWATRCHCCSTRCGGGRRPRRRCRQRRSSPRMRNVLVVAASPIVPQPGSAGTLPAGPPAMMVFAKRLDDAFLSDIGTDFGLSAPRLRLA